MGDRILKVNGTDVTAATHQEAVMELLRPGDEIKLTIQHDPLPVGFQVSMRNSRESNRPSQPAATKKKVKRARKAFHNDGDGDEGLLFILIHLCTSQFCKSVWPTFATIFGRPLCILCNRLLLLFSLAACLLCKLRDEKSFIRWQRAQK